MEEINKKQILYNLLGLVNNLEIRGEQNIAYMYNIISNIKLLIEEIEKEEEGIIIDNKKEKKE